MNKLDYRSVIVIVGPSGVGKGTLIRELKDQIPELTYSISATTRPARPGEEDGVNYYFLSKEDFHRKVDAGEFIEYAEYSGNWYGTLRSEIDRHLESGEPVILEIELQGARQIRERIPDALQVFIAPPSLESLKTRLVGRGTDTPEQVAKRLETAKEEMAARDEFDTEVVNDRLEDAVTELVAVVRKRIDGSA
jgi:guanylate kinase